MFALIVCFHRTMEFEQQKKALDALMGEGNSVTERMALAGAVDQGGLAMQETIFKQYQARFFSKQHTSIPVCT